MHLHLCSRGCEGVCLEMVNERCKCVSINIRHGQSAATESERKQTDNEHNEHENVSVHSPTVFGLPVHFQNWSKQCTHNKYYLYNIDKQPHKGRERERKKRSRKTRHVKGIHCLQSTAHCFSQNKYVLLAHEHDDVVGGKETATLHVSVSARRGSGA